MSVYLSPVGLANAQVPNRLSLLATFKERLCRSVCATSTNQPEATVTYTYDTPVLNGTTVFVPIIATITIVTPGCGCTATTQVITERFMTAFQEQSALPTAVVIATEGLVKDLINISCGRSNCLAINSSLTVTITPGTAPAAAAAASSVAAEAARKSKE